MHMTILHLHYEILTLLDTDSQTHPIDVLCSCFNSKHAEYARSTAYTQNNLPTK